MLRQERIERGWSQQYVAREVGVSRVAIHQMETGITKPSYDVLIKLENLFQLGHRELFGAATPNNAKAPDGNPAK